MAESTIRKLTVPAEPIMGKMPLAMAAPPCTLMMESITAGIGGMFFNFTDENFPQK
jgi:hypothetical protein